MHGREGRGRLSRSVVAVVSVLACIAMLAGLVMGTTHVVGWVFDAIGLASPQHRPIVIAHRGDNKIDFKLKYAFTLFKERKIGRAHV